MENTQNKKLTLEEALGVLRMPENRVNEEAFGRAWYHAYCNLDMSSFTPDAYAKIFSEVSRCAIERTEELTPKAREYLEARVTLAEEDFGRTFGKSGNESLSISEETRLKEAELYVDYLISLPEFRERAIKLADECIRDTAKYKDRAPERILDIYTTRCWRLSEKEENSLELNPHTKFNYFGVRHAVRECQEIDREAGKKTDVLHWYSNHAIILRDRTPAMVTNARAIRYFSGVVEERKAGGVK